MTKTTNRWLLPLVCVAALSADQASKAVVRRALPLGAAWWPSQEIGSFFSVTHSANTGAAFGMFPGAGAVFALAAVAVILAIFWAYSRTPAMSWPVQLGLGLVAGGAAGNLVDRLCLGYVLDFVRILFLPPFNLADLSVLSGALVLLGRYVHLGKQREPHSRGE